MMELNWKNLVALISSGLISNTLKTYSIEKMVDTVVDKLKTNSRDSIEEQLILCLNGSMQMLWEKYQFEYDVEIFTKIVYRLIEKREDLTEKTFEGILRDAIDLEMNEEVLKDWAFFVKKVIAEEKLDILRDYILVQSTMSGLQIEKPIIKEKAYPRILTAKPALAPEEYLDRDEKQIVLKKLDQNRKLVLVNGIGGIGKSTVCRKLFHEMAESEDRTLAWIVYNEKDLKEDFKRQIFYPLEGAGWDKKFTQFLQQDIEKEAVIFIDNLNVSEEEEPFLKEIANANCNIICTSRIEKYAHYEVVPVHFFTIEDCVRLFYSFYKLEYDYERIASIIKKAGRHTLVIEILGKIGNTEGYTLQELQNELDRQGFDLEGIVSVDDKEDTLIGHLCKTFSLKRLNKDQKAILYCLAVLPVQRIPLKMKNWLNLPNNYNINYLVKHAWFAKDEKGFYMHPVVKEVVKRMVEPQQNALRMLLLGLEKELSFCENPVYEDTMSLISYAEATLQFIDETYVQPQLLYNISVRYGQFGSYDMALEYIRQCIRILEDRGENQELLGSAYNHKGYIGYYMYNDKMAEESYQTAYKIRMELGNKKAFAETASSLALLYQGMWQEHKNPESREAEEMLEKSALYQQDAIGIFEDIFQGKLHSNLASAYNNMAELQISLKNFEEAECYFRKSESIRLQLQDKIAAGDLSVTYFGMGRNYKNMAENCTDFEKKKSVLYLALNCLEKCRKIRVQEIREGNTKLTLENVIMLQEEIKEILRDMDEGAGL